MRQSVLLAALAAVLPVRARPVIDGDRVDAVIDVDRVDDAAHGLSRLIDNTRQQVIADGVRPVPPMVYRSLLGYFPAMLLQKSRYATGSCRPLILPTLPLSYGDAQAIAVGDVVMFKHERTALTDMAVWAHELTHVMQYQRWGIEGFAERYVRDADAVEREAIDNAERFTTWFVRREAGPGGNGRVGAPPPRDVALPRAGGSPNRSTMATFR